MKKPMLAWGAGFAGLLFLAHISGARILPAYLAIISLLGPVVFYFLLEGASLMMNAGLATISLSLLWQCLRSRSPWFCLYWLGFLALVASGYLYRRRWHEKRRLSSEKRRVSMDSIHGMEETARDKESTHKILMQQLADITHLYELAKDLNDCLSFDKLAETLNQRVFTSSIFERSVLTIFGDDTEVPSGIRRFIFYAGGKYESSEVKSALTPFESKVLEHSMEMSESLRIQNAEELRATAFGAPTWAGDRDRVPSPTPSQREGTGKGGDAEERRPLTKFQDERVRFPLWVFPLVVQNKIIAVFTVEGGSDEDHPKFRVVSAELALQVKKIKLYDTVHELAIVDGLTQVFVRRHFLERFEEELKRSLRHKFQLSVLMLDIDFFKSYNDSHGHLVGDVTLREVAQAILSSVRRVDIVARYGGEEFALVLPETDRQGGLEVAERIRSSVARRRFRAYDEETSVTVSIGVAAFPADLDVVSSQSFYPDLILDLLRKADQALYQAKEEGRNRVVCFGKGAM